MKFILPKIHFIIEKWKFNKNYQIYVSNMGNFLDKNKEPIKLKIEHGGYLQVPLCNNKQGKIKYVQAHRIVMETWCPRADMWKAKLTVDHLDHNKRHNTVRNLEWVTEEENKRRAAADMVWDNKDALIQSLKDQNQNLKEQLQQNKRDTMTIVAVGVKKFNNWGEVRSFLIKKNPCYVNAKANTIEKAIKKSFITHNTYMGYHWTIS